MMRIIKIICFLSLIWAQFESGQTITKTGTAVAQFLKIGIDARGTAIGSAVSGLKGDLSSIYWNPAGLSHYKGMGVQFGNHDWLASMKYKFLLVGINMQKAGVIGFSVINLSTPEDLVRTVAKPEGTGEKFSANDIAVTLSYAKRLTDHFSLGASVKYIQLKIWHSSAATIAFDFGTLFTTPFKGMRLGASISNYGGKMKLIGRDQKISVDPDPNNQGNVEFVNALYETDYFPLPLTFRVGISGEIVKTRKIRVSYGIDALHPNDNMEFVNIGLEAAFSESFFLRVGYPSLFEKNSIDGPTFGIGLNYRVWRTSTKVIMDYSYADYGPLGGVDRLSIGIHF